MEQKYSVKQQQRPSDIFTNCDLEEKLKSIHKRSQIMNLVEDELMNPLNEISRTLACLGNFSITYDNLRIAAKSINFSVYPDEEDIPSRELKTKQDMVISGSVVLIDIVFDNEEDGSISLSLSSASESMNDEDGDIELEDGDYKICYETEVKEWELGNVSSFGVDLLEPLPGFMSNKCRPTARSIFYSNLTNSTTLKDFILNLEYLTNFDKLSILSFDLFKYINEISDTLFQVYKNNYQISQHGSDFAKLDAIEGYSGTGKPIINLKNSIGFYIKYWKDNRFFPSEMNHTSYYLKFNFTKHENELVYCNKMWDHDWNDNNEDFKSITGSNCSLSIKFLPYNLMLPQNLLDSLNLDYTEYDDELDIEEERDDEEYCQLEDFYQVYTGMNAKVDIGDKVFNTNLKMNKYFRFLKISKINLNKLNQLNQLLPVLRNWLMLNNFLINYFKYTNHFVHSEHKKSIISVSNLNLINANQNLRIEDFLNEFDNDEKNKRNIHDSYINLVIEQSDSCILLSLEGNLHAKVNLKINNGVFETVEKEVDIKTTKFVSGLNLTEDLFESLKCVYLT